MYLKEIICENITYKGGDQTNESDKRTAAAADDDDVFQ